MGAKRLENLSDAQLKRLPTIRDEWLAIGLDTSPGDEATAVDAVRRAYIVAGLAPPELVIWLDSPLAGCYGAAIFAQVGTQVGTQVGEQVWEQVRGQVWGQVREQVRGQVRGQVWEQVRRGGHGLQDAGWLSLYAALKEYGLAAADRLTPLMDLARHAGWWWPFAGAVILTRKPVSIARDAEFRLHCATGPALRYPDGWSIWAWHGVRVAQRLIEQPETISSDEIDAEPNAEVRRIMLERFGLPRYMQETSVSVVHEDRYGQLLRKELADDEPIVMVKVMNSTPEPDRSVKTYLLRVPPTVKTCQEGVAWTFGLEKQDYAPEVET